MWDLVVRRHLAQEHFLVEGQQKNLIFRPKQKKANESNLPSKTLGSIDIDITFKKIIWSLIKKSFSKRYLLRSRNILAITGMCNHTTPRMVQSHDIVHSSNGKQQSSHNLLWKI